MAVYLKGCGLSCKWCHSPESRRGEPELLFLRERCAVCGACVSVCKRGVHAVKDGARVLERAKCAGCGACVAACAREALRIAGRKVAAEEIVRKAVRLRPFFSHSDGGVTLTGGEVTAQPGFAEAILAGCRAEGIHTAIETCGAAPWATLKRLADLSDLILYDIKLIDEREHRRWTGASNRRILANAKRLAGRNIVIRVPLIPGITDTEANLRGVFSFMNDAGLSRVSLLPYNPSTGAKYEWVGEECVTEGVSQTAERMHEIEALASATGAETQR